MIPIHHIPAMLAVALISCGSVGAQTNAALGENAALRYWSAFAQMQDSAVRPNQTKELSGILDGTVRYSDQKYRALVESNQPAIETMERGTVLPHCDWGLDYQLGSETPIEYARKALALGRLNVLYSFHRLSAGDRDGEIRALKSGLRFSHDVAAGGSLFAALAAKTLIVSHLRAMAFAAKSKPLSPAEKAALLDVLAKIGDEGVDWESAIRREFEVLSRSGFQLPPALPELYRNALSDASLLPKLQQTIAAAPPALANRIPNPKRVFEEKQDLSDRLRQSRSMLQSQ